MSSDFWSKVFINEWEPNACWEWQGTKWNHGYGRVRHLKAHRLSFIEAGGILTKEKPFVLHKCNNRPCVRPSHLYAGDQADNTRDAMEAGTWVCKPADADRVKTHCKRGHPYSAENTYINKGSRFCRACWSIASKRSYLKRKKNG